MKANKDLLKTGWKRLAFAIALSAGLVNFTSCDKYDLDETDPEGWGATIYSYLAENGHFTNTIKLINDLGMKDDLAKERSKTMFVADDDAFNRFYSNNSWGVRNYEQLSTAQKKMLLLGSMIGNSYQVSDLSSIEGPVEGQCMRRTTDMTLFDTIPVVSVNDLPNMQPEDWAHNTAWKKFAGRDKIVLLNDMTKTPMIHFIEDYLNNHKITNDDYNWLYNNKVSRQPGEASVNGVKIIEQNIRCSNGFIHRMEDVITPLPNMAQIITTKQNTKIFSKLLERFSAPYYVGDAARDQYNYLNNTSVDSVYEKRYFAEKSQNGSKPTRRSDDPETYASKIFLKFDPAWNTYYAGLPIPTQAAAVEKNMAVMMVPSDAALNEYWNNGKGQVLKKQYGTWDNVPNDVIVELINNNMLSSFYESVPSKFQNILNDANDPIDVSASAVKQAIDSVHLACNGAVYVTNKVYAPTSFVSVLYPAIVNENLRVMKKAVEMCQYNIYLNSLNSTYSFFIPTNNAFLQYIDPTSYGKTKTQLYQFHYDEKLDYPLWAGVFEYDMETKEITDSLREERPSNDGEAFNLKKRLKDILDNHVVIGDVKDGHEYYKTKGGQEIRVTNAAAGKDGMYVEGSLQINETGKPVKVEDFYAQENGNVYILDSEPILTTRKSVLDVLAEHPEMSEFRKLLEGSVMREVGIHNEKYATASENLSVFNTFHYTVYVPNNDVIKKLQDSGELPTWEKVHELQEAGALSAKTEDSLKIENFLRLHIQDCSLFIGAQPQEWDGYETSLINQKTGKFERIYAKLTDDKILVSMKAKNEDSDDSNSIEIKKTDPLINLMAREYILNTPDAEDATYVETSSTAVIHLINSSFKK